MFLNFQILGNNKNYILALYCLKCVIFNYDHKSIVTVPFFPLLINVLFPFHLSFGFFFKFVFFCCWNNYLKLYSEYEITLYWVCFRTNLYLVVKMSMNIKYAVKRKCSFIFEGGKQWLTKVLTFNNWIHTFEEKNDMKNACLCAKRLILRLWSISIFVYGLFYHFYRRNVVSLDTHINAINIHFVKLFLFQITAKFQTNKNRLGFSSSLLKWIKSY